MTALPPGATVGIAGGGQLGWLMALAARRLGYRTCVLDPNPDCAAAGSVDHHIVDRFDERGPLQELARLSDVVTVDNEHVPARALIALARRRPLYPRPAILAWIQDRRRQRAVLDAGGLPQTAHWPVSRAADIDRLREAGTFPAVLKTSHGGYDGRGQAWVARPEDLPDGWAQLDRRPAVLETVVDFRCEVSVVLARDRDGRVAYFPVAENWHRDGVLRVTCAPAAISGALARRARELARAVADGLGYVGVLAVEMFLTGDDELLVNEIAPRVHNSGHYTLDGCSVSQFEQHIRAICGLSLARVDTHRPVAMVNLLGDLWAQGEPDWPRLLAEVPQTQLYLYRKEPRPGRKLGHAVVPYERLHDLLAALDPALSDWIAVQGAAEAAEP